MNETYLISPQKLPDEARDIARRAASLIEEVGWCQGKISESDDDGNITAVCIEGALRLAQFGKTLHFKQSEILDPIRCLLWEASDKLLGERYGRAAPVSVTGWNDRVATSPEEAAQFLLDLAEWQGDVAW